jgi:hypothetical protein
MKPVFWKMILLTTILVTAIVFFAPRVVVTDANADPNDEPKCQGC